MLLPRASRMLRETCHKLDPDAQIPTIQRIHHRAPAMYALTEARVVMSSNDVRRPWDSSTSWHQLLSSRCLQDGDHHGLAMP
jgi:hypothetical protein